MQQILFHRNYSPAPRTRKPLSLQIRVGKFFLMFTMVFIGGILCMLYLMHFTDIHTKGYELRKLELARNELVTQHEIKTMNVARVRSLSHIETSTVTASMIPMRNPIFMTGDKAFAQK